LLIHEIKGMPARKPSHLFEPFHGHERRQWLALPFDNELVVSKGHPIQHVPDPLANIHCRNSVGHS
jgi:hypothetical protein